MWSTTIEVDKEKINKKEESDISVVAIIAAFNEEVSIGSIVINTKGYVGRVIVVDDGSEDDTGDVARKAGADVIRHESNKGKGESLRTGFMAAIQDPNTKIIVTLDGDGQHYPKDIPKLIAPIKSGDAEIVIGSRRLNRNKIPLKRRFGQYILDKMTFYNIKIETDTQSGFRAFSVTTVSDFKFKSKDFHIESEMLEDAVDAGRLIKDINIDVRYRDLDCSTVGSFEHGRKIFINLVKSLEIRRPLMVFTCSGMMSVFIGLIMGVDFYVKFLDGGSLSFGPTILMMLLILIGSILIISGIILHAMTLFLEDIKDTIKKNKNLKG